MGNSAWNDPKWDTWCWENDEATDGPNTDADVELETKYTANADATTKYFNILIINARGTDSEKGKDAHGNDYSEHLLRRPKADEADEKLYKAACKKLLEVVAKEYSLENYLSDHADRQAESTARSSADATTAPTTTAPDAITEVPRNVKIAVLPDDYDDHSLRDHIDVTLDTFVSLKSRGISGAKFMECYKTHQSMKIQKLIMQYDSNPSRRNPPDFFAYLKEKKGESTDDQLMTDVK